MHRESAGFLQAVYESTWRGLGASTDEARIMANCFVRSDLAGAGRGKEIAGIAAFPLVYRWVRSGGIRFGAPLTVVKEGASFALVDGGHGPGQVVTTRAMEIAIRKAREATVGCVWIRNGNDYCMATNYPVMALEHDFFGLAMSNGVPLVAPWGGREPVFNTSPMSFAIPAGQENPIVFDGSTSSVSHGTVVISARDRLRLPPHSYVDEDGHITDDPVPVTLDAYDRNSEQLGAILPLGPKGYGWLILVDVLSALMCGMSTAKDLPWNGSEDDPWTGGIFVMAINIGNLVDLNEFKAKVDGLIQNCKSARLADGFSEIVMPGERAMRETERRRREGVPLRDEDWGNVVTIAAEVGIDLEALRAEFS
jgi:LDH2 family malate/lactate/ureidoglycolate dehydrogenase